MWHRIAPVGKARSRRSPRTTCRKTDTRVRGGLAALRLLSERDGICIEPIGRDPRDGAGSGESRHVMKAWHYVFEGEGGLVSGTLQGRHVGQRTPGSWHRSIPMTWGPTARSRIRTRVPSISRGARHDSGQVLRTHDHQHGVQGRAPVPGPSADRRQRRRQHSQAARRLLAVALLRQQVSRLGETAPSIMAQCSGSHKSIDTLRCTIATVLSAGGDGALEGWRAVAESPPPSVPGGSGRNRRH